MCFLIVLTCLYTLNITPYVYDHPGQGGECVHLIYNVLQAVSWAYVVLNIFLDLGFLQNKHTFDFLAIMV